MIKILDKCKPNELTCICNTMNPNNVLGKIATIMRMEADKLQKNLSGLIQAVPREGISVLWISDPVHSNIPKTDNRQRTAILL